MQEQDPQEIEETPEIVYSHGEWRTEEEDARICDLVDNLIQES